ncbi:alpha/beta fold hydrolase [Nonomuraea sp. NPDC050783]|uniref:alpha/beta fold hydrolase n=1 Tax=Nonomuraea sp. NPDC050783 TaxID=3154634 RepID=UPI0034661D38
MTKDALITAPARLGESHLPDGRRLGWAEWGPATGTPVVLCPGAGTSRWLGFGAGVVDELGVRLISLDRPGLGASDPSPGRTLTSWADDVAALGLGDLRVVGFSQGAPFALACAFAPAVRRVAIVSGADEVATMPDVLPDHFRDLVKTVAADPSAAETFFASLTPDALWGMIVPNSPAVDRAVYEQPGFARAYRRAMTEAFAQGPAGYARDSVLAMSPWPLPLSETPVPVDLWYGDQDLHHSPDQGRTLSRRIRGARHHLVPGAGGSLLWTHAEPILRLLLS